MSGTNFSLTEQVIINPSFGLMEAPKNASGSRLTFPERIRHSFQSEVITRIIAVATSVFTIIDCMAHLTMGVVKGGHLGLRKLGISCLNPAPNSAEITYHFKQSAKFLIITVIGSIAATVWPGVLKYFRVSSLSQGGSSSSDPVIFPSGIAEQEVVTKASNSLTERKKELEANNLVINSDDFLGHITERHEISDRLALIVLDDKTIGFLHQKSPVPPEKGGEFSLWEILPNKHKGIAQDLVIPADRKQLISLILEEIKDDLPQLLGEFRRRYNKEHDWDHILINTNIDKFKLDMYGSKYNKSFQTTKLLSLSQFVDLFKDYATDDPSFKLGEVLRNYERNYSPDRFKALLRGVLEILQKEDSVAFKALSRKHDLIFDLEDNPCYYINKKEQEDLDGRLLLEILEMTKYQDIQIVQRAMLFSAESNNKILLKNCLRHYSQKELEICEGDGEHDISPLLLAITSGNLECARFLIERGWDVNQLHQSKFAEPKYDAISLMTSLVSGWSKFEQKDCDEIIRFFKLLLKNGAEGPHFYHIPGDECSGSELLLHLCFHNGPQAKNIGLIRQCFDMLLEKKVDEFLKEKAIKVEQFIPPRVLSYLKHFMLERREYENALLQLGAVTKREIELKRKKDEVQPGSTENYLLQAGEATEILKNQLQIHNSNLQAIPIETVNDFRMLKKSIKKHMADNEGDIRADFKLLQNNYQAFVEQYDQLVSRHFLLSELRMISKEMRSWTGKGTLPSRLCRAFAMFGLSNKWKKEEVAISLPLRDDLRRKIEWNQIRSKILQTSQSVENNDFWKTHHVRWVHGTHSAALPGIIDIKAIAPTGHLININLPAFCGELCGSEILGRNANHVSGEILTTSWDDDAKMYFDLSTRLLVTLYYASQQENPMLYHPKMVYDPQGTQDRMNIKFLNRLFSDELVKDQGRRAGDISRFRMDILRMRAAHRKAEKYVQPVREQVKKMLLSKGIAKEQKDELKLLQNALNVPIKCKLSEKDLDLILHPYPIIFASMNKDSVPSDSALPQTSKEYLIDGRASLGHDLQVAFTHKENVQELQELLVSHGVKVFDMDTALYLEMQQMALGQIDKDFEAQIREKKLSEKEIAFAGIAHHIPRVLQLYSLPFPENPSFIDEKGRGHEIAKPFYGYQYRSFSHDEAYAKYSKDVAEGKVTARDIHGPLHAVRVAMLTQIISKFCAPEGLKVENPVALALAGGCHDAARQDEGEDHWDHASGNMIHKILLQMRFTSQEAETYRHALQEKDPKDASFKTLEQIIIHDADAIEILRVLTNKEEFRFDELALPKMNNISKKAGQKMKALVSEWGRFIEITKNPTVQLWIEQNSNNSYVTVIQLLSYIHEKEIAILPTSCEALKDEIDFYQREHPPLPKELTDIIDKVGVQFV